MVQSLKKRRGEWGLDEEEAFFDAMAEEHKQLFRSSRLSQKAQAKKKFKEWWNNYERDLQDRQEKQDYRNQYTDDGTISAPNFSCGPQDLPLTF